jgi:hypothetical protein
LAGLAGQPDNITETLLHLVQRLPGMAPDLHLD